MSYVGVHSTHVGEVYNVQLISQFAKSSFIKWLGEYIDKLIFDAYTLNYDIPFGLMISYEVMVDINVLGS
jgi:hypothetical protein